MLYLVKRTWGSSLGKNDGEEGNKIQRKTYNKSKKIF